MTELAEGPKGSRLTETRSPEASRTKLTATTEVEAHVSQINLQNSLQEKDDNAQASSNQVLSNHAADEQQPSTTSPITAISMTSLPGASTTNYHKRSAESPRKSRVLDPSGSLCHHWSMVVSLAFLYNFWSLSYRFAFQEIDFETVVVWFALDYSADFIYILDVVINFHTGYLEDGVLQRNIDKISVHYRECTQFYLDCFCLLPLDILYLSIGFNSILRCTRLVKIYKFWSYVERAERHTNYPNIFRTFTLVHYILVIFHWNACIFHMISKNKLVDIENLYKMNDNRCDDILCQYLKAFYWSTLALTTVGDLPRPRTKGEYIYVTVELFFGLFLFASVLGYVANIVTNVSAARKEFQAKLDAVKTFMRMRRVSDELQSKVIRWFDYLWISQKSSDEEKSVACLPDRLKAEIAIHVHLDTLKRVDIFQNTEAGFLCELVLRLKPVLFSPGDYVCRKNEVGHEMYIVSRGILEVVTNEGKTVVATLKAGSYFGEISMLNVGPAGNRRTASVRSVGYTDLFCLNKQDLWDVLKNYPNAEARIRARAEERLSKLSNPNKPRKSNDNDASRVTNSAIPVGVNQNQPNQFTQENKRNNSYTGGLLVSSNLRQLTSGAPATGVNRRRVCSSSSSSKPIATKFIVSHRTNQGSNSNLEIDSSSLTSNVVAGKGIHPKSHKFVCSTRRCLGCNARLNDELITKRPNVSKNDIRDRELDDSINGKADVTEDEVNDCEAASDGVSESVCSDYEEDQRQDNLLPEDQRRMTAKSRPDYFGLKSIKSHGGLGCVCVKHLLVNDSNNSSYRKNRSTEQQPIVRKPVLTSLARRNQIFIGTDGHLDDDQECDSVLYVSPVDHSKSFEAEHPSSRTIHSQSYYDNRLASKMIDNKINNTDPTRYLEPNDRRKGEESIKSVDSSLSGYLNERRRTRQILADQLLHQPILNPNPNKTVSSLYSKKRRQHTSPSGSVSESARSLPVSQQIHLRPMQRTVPGSTQARSISKESSPSEVEGSHHYPVQLMETTSMQQNTGIYNQQVKSRSPTLPLDIPSHVQIPVQVSMAQPVAQYLRVPIAISTSSDILQTISSQQTVENANFAPSVIQSRSMSQLTPIQLITALPSSSHPNFPNVKPVAENDTQMLLQGQQQYLIVSTGGQSNSDLPLNTGSDQHKALIEPVYDNKISQSGMLFCSDPKDGEIAIGQAHTEVATTDAQDIVIAVESSNFQSTTTRIQSTDQNQSPGPPVMDRLDCEATLREEDRQLPAFRHDGTDDANIVNFSET